MKEFNWVAIIAVVALIGFGFIACESPTILLDSQSEAGRSVFEDNFNIAQERMRVRGIADGSDFTSRLEGRRGWKEAQFNEEVPDRLLEERFNRLNSGRIERRFNEEDFNRLMEERINRLDHGRMERPLNKEDFDLLEERFSRQDHGRMEPRFDGENFNRMLENRLNRQDIEQGMQSRPERRRGLSL